MIGKSICGVAISFFAVNLYAGQDGWSYFEVPHIRTGEYLPEASVMSKNTLPLPARTKDTNYGYLSVRKNPSRPEDVSLDVEPGRRLVCPPMDCSVAIAFDDREPIVFRGAPSTDYGSTRIVIQDTKTFLAHARQAKRISVRFQDADNGAGLFHFVTPAPLGFPTKVKRLNE